MSNESTVTPTHSPSYAQLAAALAKAQAVMGGAKKDATNPHLKSKYADLASVWDACREPLTSNGLSVVQFPEAQGATVTVRTMLLHESGEHLETAISSTAKDASPQSIGSVITYLRRYSLSAMVGIAPEDDDGESAQPARQASQQAQQPRQQAAKAESAAKPKQDDEHGRLMDATSAEIARSGCPQDVLKEWVKAKGYPATRSDMTSAQLSELHAYLKTLPNAK